MRQDTSQIWLIISGVVVTALFGIFIYREFFPEYKIYQKDYIALEEFRSSYTHEPPPKFDIGIKQIVIEREDKGPPIVDRCTTCHVALQIPYFSPTKLAHDINGNIIKDEEGRPIQVPNEEYIWGKLDQKIAELEDEKVIEFLKKEGHTSEINQRLKLAQEYKSLKTAKVNEQEYNVETVLKMHPLMGKETRPFEFHPVEEYGCTSCHNGNGRGIVTDKAHGPVFDGQYEIEFEGPKPQFTESDPDNDPKFASVFNSKPGHELLFQTQPIFVGALIQSKCLQCHQTSGMELDSLSSSAFNAVENQRKQITNIQISFNNDKKTIIDLLNLRSELEKNGYQKTVAQLEQRKNDYALTSEEIEKAASQLKFLTKAGGPNKESEMALKNSLDKIDNELLLFIGSKQLINSLQEAINKEGIKGIDSFIAEHQKDLGAKGILFDKSEAISFNQALILHAQDTEESLKTALNDQKNISTLKNDIDELTHNFQHGKELYFSQACYACHRISGLTRGGVGPELTKIGDSYPWYIKESIVWPQADLKTSTMPNSRLDHEELEDLMTFLLAQKGSNNAISKSNYQSSLLSWEAGRKMPWEAPAPPDKIQNLHYSMTVFATEGCASCHRLMGFDSDVGFAIEKENPPFEKLYEEQEWFKKLFPETVSISVFDEQLPGSSIVSQVEKHQEEIDRRIVNHVRSNSIIEEIEANHPGTVESFYSNFKFAARAKNHEYAEKIKNEKDPKKQAELVQELEQWKNRIHRVLMMYIQTYGLGRIIGPKPNWSGIYRSDEWLMEHFRNPTSHVSRSIMPVMPFDDSKFYALTYMLDQLGVRNRDTIRKIWKYKGFDPRVAFEIHCSQCHGNSLAGNGPASEWVYPIPKNLRNPDFLYNLTKERVFNSIMHGVKGTPMPPWGEVAENKPESIEKMAGHTPVLTQGEIKSIVDWLFDSLTGGNITQEPHDVLKWQYQIEDVIDELKKEKYKLQSQPEIKTDEEKNQEKSLGLNAIKNISQSYCQASLFPFSPLFSFISSNQIDNSSKFPQESERVNEYFDVKEMKSSGDPEKTKYFIKRKFYTPQNIQEGQAFFLVNCAACHGSEGEGSGPRSSAMQEAKPRMLTNLDWINSHDDLRLLRSIKYGVPGTAMTPWGDFTNAVQRMQLVIFIRHLSEEQDRRANLNSAIYYGFEEGLLKIEQARIKQNIVIQDLNKKLTTLKEGFDVAQKSNALSHQQLIAEYEKITNLEKELQQEQNEDKKYVDLRNELKREKDLYYNLGVNLLSKGLDETALDNYNNLVRLNGNTYSLEKNQLVLVFSEEKKAEIKQLQNEIIKSVDQRITQLTQEENELKKKTNVSKTSEDLKTIQTQLEAYEKLKVRLNIDIDEALRSVQKQKEMIPHKKQSK